MLWLLLFNVAEAKKKTQKKNRLIQKKKKKNPNSEIPECPEHEVKSKIGNIFVDEKILEEFLWALQKKKYKFMKMGVNIYYFRIDVYFTKYLLDV